MVVTGGMPKIDRTPKVFYGGKQKRPDATYCRPVVSPNGEFVGQVAEGNTMTVPGHHCINMYFLFPDISSSSVFFFSFLAPPPILLFQGTAKTFATRWKRPTKVRPGGASERRTTVPKSCITLRKI